mmetsp:Transcript_6227/g.9391  ORF Transcript_6227/g.9391 Transcript_6227/m.9391 type:complete len:307 (-) Transcript_6227:86-1006(-)
MFSCVSSVTPINSLNHIINELWLWLYEQPIIHWNMLEAYVAGASFTLWIIIFRVMDQFPSLAKYKFPGNTPVKLFLPDHNASWLPLIVYLLSIHVYHYFVPKAPLLQDAPTIQRLIIEVAYGILAYDFIFFWIHLAMHKVTLMAYLSRHYVHHTQTHLCASEVQHHSIVDGSLQVMVNIFVQNLTTGVYGRKHFLSRVIHNVLITYMLTEIHAGYDGFWSMHRLFPRLIGGARRHELHHKSSNAGYYQQFFMYLDDTISCIYKLSAHHNRLSSKFDVTLSSIAFSKVSLTLLASFATITIYMFCLN